MGKLQFYESIEEKDSFFSDPVSFDIEFFKIDKAPQFNDWYDQTANLITNQPQKNIPLFSEE